MQKEEAGNVKNVRYPQQRQSLAHSVETAKNSLELLVSAQALGRVQRETEAAKSKAALAVLEEQAAKLAKDAEAFAWRAPLDGRVFYGQFQHGAWATAEQITPLMQPGEKLQAGQVLITVCGPRTRARADLPETDFFDVGAGLEATVSPLAAPDAKASGLVHSKSTVASSKGSFELRIDFKEAPADLFPGMKGKATIQGKPLKDVVLVPSAALAAQGTKCSVSVCKDGKTSPREVVAGKSDGKLTQVKSGLEAGEKVVVPK
jgi:biotin carboxyl carrier protein